MTTPIVLFGGPSDERHVSVASAQAIVTTLEKCLAWFWTPEGAVHDVALDDLLAHQNPFTTDYTPSRPAIFPTLEQALDTLPVEDPVFVLALHGTGGEDGTVQAMFEARGIPFTGSNAAVSAAAFDKDRAKVLVGAKLKTAESRVIRNAAEARSVIDDMLSRHEKIVLKPLAGGSSRGLYFVDRSQGGGFATALLKLPYIAEQFLSGRELTVGVIDQGEGPFPLPVIEIEIDPNRAFDYEGKYLGHGTREICPARIPDDLAKEAQLVALEAHITLGCEGYSRSDLMATSDGVYYLETNTLPGLTKTSLVPQMLAVEGISFRDFLEKQIERALSRRTIVAA